MDFVLKANGTSLPAPVKISSSDELIWSANTGRSASGKMLGSVVAGKKTVEIAWGILSAEQVSTIMSSLSSTFFPLVFLENGASTSLTVYRGAVKKEHMGYIGDGVYYYRSVSVSLVQR